MKFNHKPSKFYIYAPIYLLVVFVACVATWNWMKPAQQDVPVSVLATVNRETVPICFQENCAVRSGIFQVWPDREVLQALKGLDPECIESLCALCADSDRFRGDDDIVGSNDCIALVYSAARTYHFQELSKLPKLMLFYDSGNADLSDEQRSDLEAFFKPYRGLMREKGILIVGRASKGGSDVENQRLSYQRAANIKRLLDDILIENYKSDHIYFGSKPPQLTLEDMNQLSIEKSAYRSIRVSGDLKPDYSLRINQSVMVVVYDLNQDVFGLAKN